MRVEKKVTNKGDNTVETTKYVYHGKKLMEQQKGADVLHFYYDAEGRPAMVAHNGKMYTYLHSLQGDIVGIVDSAGDVVVEYKYDAWGKPLSITGSKADTLGVRNPFRYRGYVFDAETQLYYSRSRYYCWNKRFINSDIILNGTKNIGLNLYVYCANNPVKNMDSDGYDWNEIETFGKMYVANLKAILEALELSVSIGNGIGGESFFSAVFPMLKSKVALVAKQVNEFGLDDGGFYSKSIASFEVTLAFGKYQSINLGIKREHYFTDEKCTCNPRISTFSDQWKCPANEVSGVTDSSVLGTGYGFYFLIGGGFSASFNLEEYLSRSEKYIQEIMYEYLSGGNN